MTLEELIRDAVSLGMVSREAGEEYDRKFQTIVDFVDSELDAYQSIDALIGRNPRSMMYDNHAYHARFMANVFKSNQFELLARLVPWVYRAYHSHGFSYDYFPVELRSWKRAVEEKLVDKGANHIIAIYDWMIAHHSQMIELSLDAKDPQTAVPGKWTDIRRAMLECLIEGNAKGALDLSRRSVKTKSDLKEFYLQVIQPSLCDVGTLWEKGDVSVAEEHLATSIIGRVMASFYASLFDVKPSKGVVVVTAAPNELHEVGARMVADFFEIDGWDTRYLGANTPIADLKSFLSNNTCNILVISVAMPFNLDKAQEALDMVRGDPLLRKIRVLIGGRVFNDFPELRKSLRSDGWASDAEGVIEVADRWYREGVFA